MNVYVRELGAALAQAGVECDVYTRAADDTTPDVVEVEPGFRVRSITAGPRAAVPKESLPELVDSFADGVAQVMHQRCVDVVHANYWLSGVAGHRLKHDFGLPLVSTFHTLARVKAAADIHEPPGRDRAEADIIGCSDAVLASCQAEADQIVGLYGADPARIEIIPPGVDHAFFSPGDRAGARGALGLGDGPVLLFVGRIQPLKGADLAVRTLATVIDAGHPDAVLLLVGGPSGAEGPAELARLHDLAARLGVDHAVRFVPPRPHHLLSSHYRAADVTLVPSHSESFGLVALESAACGTPVVAAAVGGLTSLVDHEVTGFLIDDRDPVSHARPVLELLADPGRAAAMSAAAAAGAQRYRWSTAAARLRRTYDDLAVGVPVACR